MNLGGDRGVYWQDDGYSISCAHGARSSSAETIVVFSLLGTDTDAKREC